jgi:hypothetical protein
MASIGNDGRWLQPRPLLDAEKPKARLSGAGAIRRSRPEMSHFEIAGDKRIYRHLSGSGHFEISPLSGISAAYPQPRRQSGDSRETKIDRGGFKG